MEISFGDKKLAKTCSSEKALVKAFGTANARKIMLRLSLLEAAECLSDVPTTPPTRRHELKGSRKGEFAIDVQQPFRIVLRPAHDPVPKKEDGGIDLSAVTAIEIINIEDYH